MRLLEKLQKGFLKPNKTDLSKVSSVAKPDSVIKKLDGEELSSAFFNGDALTASYLNFSTIDKNSLLSEQANKIDTYRKLALYHSEVKACIDEIVNETVSCPDGTCPIELDYEEENTKIKDAVQQAFDGICRKMSIDVNIYNIVERAYIDGQLVLHLVYNPQNLKGGIKSIEILDPRYLQFDTTKRVWKYTQDTQRGRLYVDEFSGSDKIEYSPEEIVRVDFGLYDKDICLSYLEYAIKNANILKNLEDLLVPLRFSRSISRRVFNVDVGNLPPKRIEEVMQQVQNKFRYKKFYNTETGEISNQQHVTTMVEDMWFPNRAGGKGTTVDLLDESGNLGEITDILYYARKLYRSLNVPLNRIALDESVDHYFDYESTSTSKDDIKFFIFISKLRRVYTNAFKQILKRQVISTKIMTEKEWNSRADDIVVKFSSENQFIEKMRHATMRSKMEIYEQMSQHIGKLFSAQYLLKNILGLNDQEIDAMTKEIADEQHSAKFSAFYEKDEY